MAEQGTEEKTDPTDDEGAGRHAASEESGSGEQHAPAEQEESSQQESSQNESGQKDESSGQQSDSGSSEQQTEQKAEQKTERSEQQSGQNGQQNGQARSERPAENGSRRGQADTSWAEPEHEESRSSRRSVDVGELAWRTGNVLATVVRTLALLFAAVLVVDVVLVLVGVNPANGVAQFVATVAGVVILGFRDLFLPASPTLMLIVNSLIAAVFWVFVGELLSRLIRYLAARVK